MDARWTKAAPAAPGWYWWCSGGPPVIVFVQDLLGELVIRSAFADGPWTVANLTGHWIGPIETPDHPEAP